MSPTKNLTANPEKNPPTLRQLLERIANYTEDLERRTGNTIEVTSLLSRIAESVDTVSLNQEETTNVADSLKEAIEANTLKLDDIYGVLLEILQQSHNPLKPLPPMPPLPVGRWHGNHDEEPPKPKRKGSSKLDRIEKEGFQPW